MDKLKWALSNDKRLLELAMYQETNGGIKPVKNKEELEKIDELRFRSQEEKHELSHLYETKIKNMGNAGRNGGEY